MTIETEMLGKELSPDKSTVKWQLFVHLEIKLNVRYTSCKFSCHILARWKSDPCKCRYDSCVFCSLYYCAPGVTELLVWEEKIDGRRGKKWIGCLIFGGWLSSYSDRWFLLGHWGLDSQIIPVFWARTRKKKCRQQGLRITWELQTIKPGFLPFSKKTQKIPEGTWAIDSHVRTPNRRKSLLFLIRKGLSL